VRRRVLIGLIAALLGGCLGEHPGNRPNDDPNSAESLNCELGAKPGPRVIRLLTRREYAASVAALLGVPAPDVRDFPEEPLVHGFDTNAAAVAVTARHVDTYYDAADRLVRQALASQRGRLVPCTAGSAGCDRQVVTNFGKRAFRRPLEAAEVDRYAALFAADLTGGSFDEGVALAATSMLVSPSFLYRTELGAEQPDGRFKLTGHEVAAALSYTFWGAPPDDALLAAADSGALDSAEQVEAKARTMLSDPRARAAVGEFFTQWIGVNRYGSATKDASVYPRFNDGLRAALLREQQEFVAHVVFDTPGSSYRELLTADYVVANRQVLELYQIPGGSDQFTRVAVPAGVQRGGLLTLGALLGTHAHPNESSPIKRGVFVRTHLLCEELAPPPPDVSTVPPGLDPSLTTRERFARHSSDQACAGCHARIDPVGFGLERFDGIGAYRDTEGGKPIDDSGNLFGFSPSAFKGPRELASAIASSEQGQSCAATQYFRYFRGVKETGPEKCTAQDLGALLRSSNGNLREVLAKATSQLSFLVRRADPKTP
jgi:hypothetical protein